MKKSFIALASLLLSANMFGQVFTSEAIDHDSQLFTEIMKREKQYGNKRWAAELAENTGIGDNGEVIFKHVIEYNDSLSTDQIIDKTIEWAHFNFSNIFAVKHIDRDSEVKSITIEASLGKVAQNTVNLIYYVKKIDILADINMTIKFKEGRLRIESYTKHYTYTSGDSFLTGKHILIAPGSVYPFVEDAQGIGDKATCAVAYINTVDNILRFHRSYKDFLNREFEKILTDNTDEDW